jgi:hypothetical protein
MAIASSMTCSMTIRRTTQLDALRRDDLAALSITLAPFAARMLALRPAPLHQNDGIVDHAVHSDNVPQES